MQSNPSANHLLTLLQNSFKLLVFGYRNLIKNIKQTAVINILKAFIL